MSAAANLTGASTSKRSPEQAAFAQDLKDSMETLVDGFARILHASRFGSKVS